MKEILKQKTALLPEGLLNVLRKIRSGARKIIKKGLYLVGYGLFIPLSILVPKNKKYVVLTSRFGDFEGNLKYFFLYLNGLDEDLEFIFLTEKKAVYRKLKEEGFRTWYYPGFTTVFRMLRTPYLIVDGNEWAKNLKYFILYNTRKVQLWHGTGLKTVGLLKPAIKNLSNFRQRLKKEYIFYHLLSLSSEYQAEVRGAAFKYGRLLLNGLPRNDIFFREGPLQGDLGCDRETIEKCVRLRREGLKIAAYTPTWRKFDHTFEQLDLERLNRFARDSGILVVIKLHYKHDCGLELGRYTNVIEYDKYADVYPLLAQTDLLITDYSSIYLDFLILDRPIVFYPYDGAEYIGNERELLLDYAAVTPGPKCFDQDELEKEIYRHLAGGRDEYREQRSEMAEKFFKYRDGRSAERLWKAMQETIFPAAPPQEKIKEHKKKKKKSKKPHLLPNLLVFGLLRRPRTAADTIHCAYVRYFWRQRRGKRSRLKVIRAFLLSPLKIAKEVRAWSGRLGRAAADAGGKSLWRQRLEQFYLAFFFSINSKNYYLQEFYTAGGLERARHFVNEKSLKNAVYSLMGAYGRHLHRGTEICSMGRKIEFADFCREKGLPVVPVLLQFMADGTIHDFRQEGGRRGELPAEDLFCKPNVDNKGRGAEIWYWRDPQGYENPAGKRRTAGELAKRLTAQARRHSCKSYLVQPLVLPHPALAPFRKQASPTIRIITYTDLDGENRVERAMLRFSRNPAAVVDNASAGGMVAPIDLATGELGPAVDSDPGQIGRRWEQLLDNGAQIRGRLIPCWKECLELVLRAHQYFPQRLIVGWDVLVTAEGPVILEGNSQPGVCFIQKAHQEPLGEMEAGRALAAYSRKAFGALYNGRIGCGDSGEELDLYGGSPLKRRLGRLGAHQTRAVHLLISGRVQGIFYRKWLQRQARKRDLAGWVRNRFDGSVEAVLKGRASDVEDVVRSAWLGPAEARVDSVKVNLHEGAVGRGFEILESVGPEGSSIGKV